MSETTDVTVRVTLHRFDHLALRVAAASRDQPLAVYLRDALTEHAKAARRDLLAQLAPAAQQGDGARLVEPSPSPVVISTVMTDAASVATAVARLHGDDVPAPGS